MKKTEFESIWKEHFNGIVKCAIPSYGEYLINERMVEDYLDIFRGKNTRPQDSSMPYEHPFFNLDGTCKLAEIPRIKYILVGEARPLPKDVRLHSCNPIDADLNNTYVYDIRHLKSTPWLSALIKAWKCNAYKPCTENKIDSLLCSASKGVLLLDLFPYPIKYSSPIREKLNKSGTTKFFWLALENKINSLRNELIDGWDLSFVTPYKVSDFILKNTAEFDPLKIIVPGTHSFRMREACTKYASKRAGKSTFKKQTINRSYLSPSAELIASSFGL